MPIFDQGYQHWEGQLSGHAWRWLVITRHGVRGQLRNWGTRILLILSWLPAMLLVGALAAWGLAESGSGAAKAVVTILMTIFGMHPEMLNDPETYRLTFWTLAYHRFFQMVLYSALLMVLVVGSSLISQDMRLNAFPLYLSRPLTRLDYFVGKLGVVVTCVGLVTVLPVLVAYILGVLFSLDLSVIGDTYPILFRSLAYCVVIALSSGVVMLGLSALSRNSRYVALMWVGLWLISAGVTETFSGFRTGVKQIEFARAQNRLNQAEIKAFSDAHKDDEAATPWEAVEIPETPEVLEARQKAKEAGIAYVDSYKHDWSWLLSFADNIRRLETAILDTNSAWSQVHELENKNAQWQFNRGEGALAVEQAEERRPQYPWYYSGAVLLGLMGVSAWILNVRVRSLDRLK